MESKQLELNDKKKKNQNLFRYANKKRENDSRKGIRIRNHAKQINH